ncbi:PTS system N-acetylgalactosamine-specific IIA component [Breznakia sp. PF5-3]|uniref:PTS sugar transporter subunit IIA n=1 Tax=unclassified Breznakia TaxID=2623764 RepID=UPI002404CDF2|nr:MULTISPECIES: PTS sugar transporter subunit IIA [unclassified Breznakia]MDF9824758.1 PTS system N-acetylgalactosamine-specific IIA component [Breznakia sp. PM6-1]MDF9835675.1 PTS system N-acetylgalactosamine-specific IIA component [Breznakia sp. PF5-3]MDF9837724.1 PTS system N-acetylgalactosamine-specific IIA component [Breznakia sp. PFB2-8]MDF9859685.1 PTS system N-acetylgalactosamine-specific IIA component [Breznakia sp. PH5-24]
MIGLVLTGHGEYASGLTSSLKLIAGDQLEQYEYIDFKKEDDVDTLERNIKTAFDRLENCDGILVCCDLIGGSPFKSAVTLGMEKENVKVVAGTNLPMLLEVNTMRFAHDDVATLAHQIAEVGKQMIMVYEYEEVSDTEGSDGI